MKILLKKDVENLGKEGEIKEVKPGYARNFLIPKNLAIPSTLALEAKIQEQIKTKKAGKESEKQKLAEIAKKLNNAEIVFEAKVGKNQKLFGSITQNQIRAKIKEFYDIDLPKETKFRPKTIKKIGTSRVEIKLKTGIDTKVKVKVKTK